MRGDEAPVRRLTELDGARGLAALGVVVFHYQHFGGVKTAYPGVNYSAVAWLYAHGWALVDFFFLLSGVVMTHKYLELVATRRISGRDFFWLRFSRIYPLHLLTLLVVAGEQWRLLWLQRAPKIYSTNDLYHFALNLGLLQSGGLEEGFSFNAPSWSIAVEMVAYLVFFQLARRCGARYVTIAAIVAFGCANLSPGVAAAHLPLLSATVSRAVFGFLLGSLIHLGLRRANELGFARRLGVAAFGLLALFVFIGAHLGPNVLVGGDEGQNVLHYSLPVFPLVLVAVLELRPLAWLLSLPPFEFLGDISYAMYMVHVPMQIALLSYVETHAITLPTEQPKLLFAYLAAVIVVATLAHHLFDLPARAWLRRKFKLGSRSG